MYICTIYFWKSKDSIIGLCFLPDDPSVLKPVGPAGWIDYGHGASYMAGTVAILLDAVDAWCKNEGGPHSFPTGVRSQEERAHIMGK